MTLPLTAIVNARLAGRAGLYRVAMADGRFSAIDAQAASQSAAAA